MTAADVPNTCVMTWPFCREPECDSWLIGWNPHGLVVIVVMVVEGPHFEKASEVLQRLKEAEDDTRISTYKKHKDVPSVASLLILGRLRGKGARTNVDGRASVCTRSHRRLAELWLELDAGPLLHQLYCCGYRVEPCHLHVLRADPSVAYAVTPTAFSAVARHDRSNIIKLVEGKLRPICVEGTSSTLEGVLLPSHMVGCAGPRAKMRRMMDSDSQTGRTTEGCGEGKQEEEAGDDCEPAEDTLLADSGLSSRSGEGLCARTVGKELHSRLDFPTSGDYGELGSLLQVHGYGKLLREWYNTGGHSATWGDRPTPRPRGWQQALINGFLGGLVKLLLLCHMALKWPASVSYTAALLELRLRMVVHWLLLLKGDTKICCLHPVLPHVQHDDPALQRFCVVDFTVRFLVDGICGAFLSLLLSYGTGVAVTKVVALCRWLLHDVHMEYMDWFEGWPAGLKMNEDLSMTLSLVAKFGLQASWASVEDLGNVGFLYKVLVFVSPFGASCAFAFAADLCLIASLHLYVVFRSISLPYRLARFMLGNLFLQFQGKKYNPLRHRTDAYDFPVEQTLVATVIFTIIVFLFPTLAVYHVYFALVCIALWLVQGALLVAAHLTLYLPLYPLLYWVLYRRQWPGGVAVTRPELRGVRQHMRAIDPLSRDSLTVEFGVVSKPLGLHVLVADFLLVAHVAARLHPFDMIVAVFNVRRWERTNPGRCLVPPLPVDLPLVEKLRGCNRRETTTASTQAQ